jgi:hypothetical protein
VRVLTDFDANDEKDTDRESSLEDGLVVDSPGEEAIGTGKDDWCVIIGQEKSMTECTVQLLVQDLLMEVLVDTGQL